MSNNVWDEQKTDYHGGNEGNSNQCRTQNSVRFTHPNPTKKQKLSKPDNDNGTVTYASSGFSEGMRQDTLSNTNPNVLVRNPSIVIVDGDLEMSKILSMDADPKNQPSVSSVSGLTPVTENTTSTSIIQCGENWKKMRKNMILEGKQQKKRIDSFVKKYVFSHLKFISSPSVMIFWKKKQFKQHGVHRIKHKD